MSVDGISVSAPRRRLASLARLRQSGHHLYAVLTSAAQVFAIRLLGAGLTYVSTIIVARALGSYEFGIYAYVSVVVMLLGIALSFGFNSSTLRFVPNYLARRRARRLSGFLKQSYGMALGVGCGGALLAAAIVWALRGIIEDHFVKPLLLGLLCVPVWTLLNQLEATARALGWMKTAYVPGYILRPLVLTGVVGAVVLFGGTADAITATLALCAACATAALAQGAVVYSGIREHLAVARPAFHTAYWVATSLGFLVIDALRITLDNIDVLMIGRLIDPHSVAIYFAVIRTGGLVALVSFSMIALSIPKFAEIHSIGTRDDLQRLVSSVTRLIFWPSCLVAGALAALGPFVLSLFGPEFRSGYPTMLVVLIGLVLRSSLGPVEYLLNMTGHHRDTISVYAVAAAANVALNLWLIPAYGIIGAAIATHASMIGATLCLHLLVRKRLRVSAFVSF
jgi:O-antigen/teichoic acid export membrane protein